MPAISRVQQRAAAMALAAKKGKLPVSKLRGPAKGMYKSMTKTELEHYAGTKHRELPKKVKQTKKKGAKK